MLQKKFTYICRLILKNRNMFVDIKEVKKFDKWMRKIKNIHYPNNEKMLIAYDRVEPLKYNPVN